jgi:protein TonB
MNFALQRPVAGNSAGLVIVVLFHVLLGYALVNGLGRKMINVLKKPLDVAIIEEIRNPPPPAPKVLAPAAKVMLPIPSFVPPPEVTVAAPPAQNVITTGSQPDPAPVPMTTPVTVAPPTPAAQPAISVKLACPNHLIVRSQVPYPSQAQQMGLNGDVVIEFTVGVGGQIAEVTVVKSTSPLFNDAAINAVHQLRCDSQGRDVRVRVPFSFRVES